MELGSSITCAKHLGGVESIRLVSAVDIEAVEYDTTQRLFSGLRLREGSDFAEVLFADGGACFEERVEADGTVSHHLSFRMQGLEREAADRLRGLSVDGVVAVVGLPEGEKLLVGYSPEAAADYPLRLSLAVLSSAQSRVQRASTTLTLSSTDGSLACHYEE